MQQSMRERIQWEIELPRLVDWELGDQVSGELAGLLSGEISSIRSCTFPGRGRAAC